MRRSYTCSHVFLNLFVYSCLCDASLAISTFQSYMGINTDGSIVAGTQMPACGSGRKIKLIKVTYHKRKCERLCLHETTVNASSDIEDGLYEMCSYKEMCTTMGFLSTSVERDSITGVNVSYRCIDSKGVVDMCAEKAVYFTSETHLMGTRPMSFFKDCRCYIKGGPFRITVTDLRLQSKSGRNCSSTILVISTLIYDCSKPDYKNMFNQLGESSVTRAFISMTSAIENSTAEMVWITLRPEDSSRCSIRCSTVPRYTTTKDSTLSSTYFFDPSNHTEQSVSAIKDQERPSEEKGTDIGIGISVMLVMSACLGIGMYFFLKRRKLKSNVSSKTETCLKGTTTIPALDSNNRCAPEQQSVENIYASINYDLINNMTDSADDTEYDKAGNAPRTISKDLHYNHLSEVDKARFSDTLKSVLSKRDTPQYSFAKELKE